MLDRGLPMAWQGPGDDFRRSRIPDRDDLMAWPKDFPGQTASSCAPELAVPPRRVNGAVGT